jgi:hypothetical protein
MPFQRRVVGLPKLPGTPDVTAPHEVKLFLKDRSRIMQLTDCDDGVLKIAGHRAIYQYKGKAWTPEF